MKVFTSILPLLVSMIMGVSAKVTSHIIVKARDGAIFHPNGPTSTSPIDELTFAVHGKGKLFQLVGWHDTSGSGATTGDLWKDNGNFVANVQGGEAKCHFERDPSMKPKDTEFTIHGGTKAYLEPCGGNNGIIMICEGVVSDC